MLQQTTVTTVAPRYHEFLRRWPTVKALASASLDDVLHEWQGLGYYARARNLHRCAVSVARNHGGIFPVTEAELRTLPGIGDYTVAAIAAIAYGQPTAPVDGNIIRVVSRLGMIETPMPGGKKQVAAAVKNLMPVDRSGDFAQAMMDLGAAICTPRKPKCDSCPWNKNCCAHKAGEEEQFPVKRARREKPTRYGAIFWLMDAEGRVLLRRRPEKGLLGGMMEYPSTDWREAPWPKQEAVSESPVARLSWQSLQGEVRHTFTHFHLVLDVLSARLTGKDKTPATNGVWCTPDKFGDHALPTVMKKVAAHALNEG